MIALQYAAGMLIVGAIILLVAIAIDQHAEQRRRKRMDKWRNKK